MFGFRSGVTAAAILIALLVLARLAGADDSTLPLGIDLQDQVGLFIGAGILGGFVMGALSPLGQSRLGSAYSECVPLRRTSSGSGG
jgi:hypothetical protein